MAEERPDIKIGNKVRIGKEKKFLTVKLITSETVRIGDKDVVIGRLYFKEKHQPEFDWRVKEIKK